MSKFQAEYKIAHQSFEDFILVIFVLVDDLYQKVAPLFGMTQKITVEGTFTLPKNRDEYRFGLILNDSKEISYEAVVRNRAFPLRQDVVCELHLTYTYGKDISYELTFKPLNSQSFNEAKVTWADARGQDYQNLPVPQFSADTENWQTLQHLHTNTGKERDALDWIKNVMRRRVVIDFERDEYHIGFKDICVKTIVDGEPAIVQIPKDSLNGQPAGTWSTVALQNKNLRREVFISSRDWHIDGRGNGCCDKEIDGRRIRIYENNFLFAEHVNFYADMTVTLEIIIGDKGSRAMNILADSFDGKFYWTKKIEQGNSPCDLQKFSVMYPLHKVYANGRSSKTPGCPENFRHFIRQLVKVLPQDTITAYKNNNVELFKKLLRIMCVMAADVG